MKDDARPPVAIGHVSLRVTDVPQASADVVSLGMRLIHQTPTFCVLELRGGTHLVLRVAEDPIPSRTKAPFDLMVDDVLATRRQYDEAGFKPSEIEPGQIHQSFTVVEPGGHTIKFNSTHVSDQPV